MKEEKKKHRKRVDHNGIEYKSLSEMCKAYGISTETYRNRKNKGMSLEEILTTPKKKGRKSIPITDHTGKTYKSKEEMCKAYGISTVTYKRRLEMGMGKEEALTHGIIKTIVGNYITIIDLASNNGIDYGTLWKLLSKRIDLDVAVILPKNEKIKINRIDIDGKALYETGSLSGLATARQLVEYYRPEFLGRYDELNPYGIHRPIKLSNAIKKHCENKNAYHNTEVNLNVCKNKK